MRINTLLTRDCRAFAVLITFALSMWLSLGTLVNSDGILYLRSAEAFQQGQWQEAFRIYPWAFYAWSIAQFSSLTHLSVTLSAQLINATLYAFMMWGFLNLLNTLSDNKTLLWFGFATLLAHPGLNGYREYIVRDFGQWAFICWGVYFIVRFAQHPAYRYAFAWALVMGLATLFRYEAGIVFALGPVALLFTQTHLTVWQRVRSVVQMQSFLLAGLTVVGIVLYFMPSFDVMERIKSVEAVQRQLTTSNWTLYQQHAQALAETFSVFFKPKHGGIALAGALLAYATFLFIKLLSPLYALLAGFAVQQRLVHHTTASRVISWFIALYAFVIMRHLTHHYFLSSRYLMPIALLCMLWVPFALYSQALRRHKILLSAVAVIMLYMFVDGVTHFGYSKDYIMEASDWVNQNTVSDTRIYANSTQLAFYTKRPGMEDWQTATDDREIEKKLKANDWSDYDVLVLRYSKKSTLTHQVMDSLKHYPQKDFHNKRKDGVRVIILKQARVSNPEALKPDQPAQ